MNYSDQIILIDYIYILEMDIKNAKQLLSVNIDM